MDILHFLAPYLGVIGSFLFAMVNIPVIIKIHMDKSTEGTSFIFVLMSFFANICCGSFVRLNPLYIVECFRSHSRNRGKGEKES